MTTADKIRIAMVVAALAIGVACCIPQLAEARAVFVPVATGLFGWAMKAPGHGDAP